MMVYKNRYQAEKDRRKGSEVIVKVSGGYVIMTYDEYAIWKKQK